MSIKLEGTIPKRLNPAYLKGVAEDLEDYLKCETETLEDLMCNGLKIIQSKNAYRFAIDSVLLANFVKAKPKDRIIDLGTGSGVIPILLSAKTQAREIVGLELEHEAAQRAKRSVEMNKLEPRVTIVEGDLKNANQIFGRESFSVVVSNPPYMRVEEGRISPDTAIAMARHEIAATLSDVVKAAAGLLSFGGRFFMVYRTLRLADALWEMKDKALEPKVIRFIHPKAASAPNLFLVMAQKGAGAGLKMLPPLVVYKDDGSYTEEILSIYGKEED